MLLSPFLYFPVHDFIGVLNTRYSSKFSDTAFSKVSHGMQRAQVIELLGKPLNSVTYQRQPLWYFRTDENTKAQYGRQSEIDVEVLRFSEPKGGWDFETAFVVLGPDATVIEASKWVTD